jgi:hypothetical protein
MNLSDKTLENLTEQTIITNKSSKLAIVHDGADLNLEPVVYPVAKIDNHTFLIDQSRAFISFLAVIDELLLYKTSSQLELNAAVTGMDLLNWNAADYFGENIDSISLYPTDFS